MRKVYLITLSMIIFCQWGCEKNNQSLLEFTDSRDGQKYDYLQIGTQNWMVENLAYLHSVSDPEKGSDAFPYYYVYDYMNTSVIEAKSTVNYTEYGVLYNWYAAKKACPDGWHLPSDEEWKTLEKHLGMGSSDADKVETRNSGGVGKKFKSSTG